MAYVVTASRKIYVDGVLVEKIMNCKSTYTWLLMNNGTTKIVLSCDIDNTYSKTGSHFLLSK